MDMTRMSEVEKPAIFRNREQDQQQEARRKMQQVSTRLDKDNFDMKKMIRNSWRINVATENRLTPNNRVSTMLLKATDKDALMEEDIQKNVAESIIDVFEGCHQDGLKITMFLRGILLQNFHKILKETSLICGAITASSLL